ncbi:hypothetical protein [Mesorhizobium sp. CN2-181]|uniref:hypothetical protein n=1 Tax=Mesorhizobium yinganensis TaxID=3157707 RepID=UPI0032B7DE69
MGFFSPDKTVVVSSVVYNLAGEEKDRPQYLKSLVVGNVLSGTKDSMSETITNGYLSGPAIKFRSFYRWANKPENYGEVGMPTGTLTTLASLDPDLVSPVIPHDPGTVVWTQRVDLDEADHAYWAEQWILENRPADIETEWSADYDEDANEITITFEDTSIEVFTPVGFDHNAEYVYAYYIIVTTDTVEGAVVPGSLIDIDGGVLPSTTGWTLMSETLTNHPVTLPTTITVDTHVVKSYSDARPDEVSDDTDGPTTSYNPTSYDTFTRVWQRDLYYGGDDELIYEREIMTQTQAATVEEYGPDVVVDEDVVIDEDTPDPGVDRTTTTTVTTTTEGEEIVYDRSYQVDKQDVIVKAYSPMKLMIYKIGSGNAALDALVEESADYGNFFPFLPVRLHNFFLSPTHYPDAYEQIKKAYKKATGSKFTKLIDQIEDNDDLEDIDNAYIQFGVSLNVVEEACRRYIYTFLEQLQVNQIGGPEAYQDYVDHVEAQMDIAEAWLAWKERQQRPSEDQNEFSPDVDPEPPRPQFKTMPSNGIRITGSGEINSRYDTRLTWTYITDGEGTGLGKPGAKVNDCWLQYVGSDEITRMVFRIQNPNSDDFYVYEKIRIYRQRTADSYTYLEVVGLVHRNYVYGGKAIRTTAKQALADVDESGFIVPLHYDTWRHMSLVDTTQMATACVFVVFNCYEIHKQKWYETGVFRILIVIVIAIVSVMFTGGAGVGLLGTHMSVGSALGFSGMTAAIVGSIVNSMAALVLSTMLEKVAQALGPLGQIFTTLAMMFIGNFAGGIQSGSLAIDWSSFLRIDNLLSLTNAIGNAVAGFKNLETASIYEDMQDLAKKAEAETKKIQQAYFDEFGYGGGQIDPFMFTNRPSMTVESSDTFLTRTLMTGSDLAEMSKDLLNSFSDLSLKLPNAFT